MFKRVKTCDKSSKYCGNNSAAWSEIDKDSDWSPLPIHGLHTNAPHDNYNGCKRLLFV